MEKRRVTTEEFSSASIVKPNTGRSRKEYVKISAYLSINKTRDQHPNKCTRVCVCMLSVPVY